MWLVWPNTVAEAYVLGLRTGSRTPASERGVLNRLDWYCKSGTAFPPWMTVKISAASRFRVVRIGIPCLKYGTAYDLSKNSRSR